MKIAKREKVIIGLVLLVAAVYGLVLLLADIVKGVLYIITSTPQVILTNTFIAVAIVLGLLEIKRRFFNGK